MKAWLKVLLGISLSFMCIFTSLGYAGVSTQLEVLGEAQATPPDFDSMVITNVIVCAGTTALQTNQRILPTNVKSVISGNAGQKIVYCITARNDSESNTYVFAGAVYDKSYGVVADKVTISPSADENGSQIIPTSKGANYYEGIPIAPGEEITFYATYTLTEKLTEGELIVNFNFLPVIYSITYMVENDVYAIDCITDNSTAYTVRKTGPNMGSQVFKNWINASAESVSSYPAGNTNSYTLSAKWQNVYQIIFVDNNGNIIYQESFTNSSNSLSAEGQQIVNEKLNELSADAAQYEMIVSWEEYDIKSATKDIIVHPVYTYNGNLRYTPVDEDKDGIIDYYQLDAVDTLPSTVRILGKFNGLDVKVVNKLYANNNNFDYSSGVNTIIINEGVQLLKHNSLAYTEHLNTVYLPSTITRMEKNVFSRNLFNPFGNDDKKVLTINYNGTMAQWKALVSNSENDWHNGLLDNSKIICTDGYFQLNVSWGNYNWREYPN